MNAVNANAANARTLSYHHAVKTVIVLGFAMLIVYLVKTDSLTLYIAPRMAVYVKWSAVALYAVGLYELYLTVTTWWGKTSACDCDHPPSRSPLKNTAVYGLFVLPLLLGFLLPSATMGSSMAAKKGMNLNGAAAIRKESAQPAAAGTAPDAGTASLSQGGALTDAQLNKLFQADKFTQAYANYGKQLYAQPVIDVKDDLYLETLNTVELYADNFIGHRLELSGFVYRQDGLQDDQFVIGRFAVQCCSADAAPFGMLIQTSDAKLWANDTWVRVSGTVQKTTFDGEDIVMLKAEQVTKQDAPKDKRYVYPNPNFGA